MKLGLIALAALIAVPATAQVRTSSTTINHHRTETTPIVRVVHHYPKHRRHHVARYTRPATHHSVTVDSRGGRSTATTTTIRH